MAVFNFSGIYHTVVLACDSECQNEIFRRATPVVLGLFSVVCVFVGLYFLQTKIKIALTRCHILRLKCTKIDFFWGSAPDPAGGAYSAPPDPLAGFKVPYF